MDDPSWGLEVEVKLRAGGAGEALERLRRLRADLVEPRAFEDNDVYDTPGGRLRGEGSLLRLRIVGGRGLLTFKEKVVSDLRAKVRREVQTAIESPDAARAILGRLGLIRVYRYQKFRSYYVWTDPGSGGRLAICLDETPIGVFLELEGAKESIDRAASLMGYGERDYILDDYRSLHHAALRERGLPEADLVFGDDPASRPAR